MLKLVIKKGGIASTLTYSDTLNNLDGDRLESQLSMSMKKYEKVGKIDLYFR